MYLMSEKKAYMRLLHVANPLIAPQPLNASPVPAPPRVGLFGAFRLAIVGVPVYIDMEPHRSIYASSEVETT